MLQPLLHIRDLSVDFVSGKSHTEALKNIGISVSGGELLAIVGESGSEKSVTALSVLQWLVSPPAMYRTGQIMLNTGGETHNLLQLSETQLCSIRGNRVTMIFQEPMTSLNPVMPPGARVMEALRQHKKISVKDAKQVPSLYLRK